MEIRGGFLTVAMPNHFNIYYEGNVEDEFGKGKTNDLIEKYILSNLSSVLKIHSFFDSIEIVTYSDKERFSQISKMHSNYDTIKINHYKNDTTTLITEKEPNYILVLQNVSIYSKVFYKVFMVGFVPVGGMPYKPLEFSSKFFIWDNKNKCKIKWGSVTVSSQGNGPVVTIDLWKSALSSYVSELLYQTPFAKKLKPIEKNSDDYLH
jgi:hypothetical protein